MNLQPELSLFQYKMIALPNLVCTKDNISSVLTSPMTSEVRLLFTSPVCM